MRFWKDKPEIDSIIQIALDQGYTVELERAEDYGYHITIDGVQITKNKGRRDPDEGLPHETFEMSLNSRIENLPDEVEELLKRMMKFRAMKHEEAIENSESNPWFVKQLKDNGLWGKQLVDWVDYEKHDEVQAAITKARLEDLKSKDGEENDRK